MGRAKAGDAWLTVMGNISALAVASLADTACIILTENAWLDEDAKRKADQGDLLRSAGFIMRVYYDLHPFLPIPCGDNDMTPIIL